MAEIIQKRGIHWEADSRGVAIRYSHRKGVAYPVGSREDAERELLRPRPPDPVADDTGSLVLADCLLRLPPLAPDIVTAIINGRNPSQLTPRN